MSEENKNPILKRLNLNSITNIICLLGVVVLFVLYFSDVSKKSEIEPKKTKKLEKTFSKAQLKIAFVDTDILIEQYDFAHSLREEMYAEQKRLESDLTRQQREFQSEVENFQKQIQQGQMAMEEAQIKEQELMQKQQNLMALNEQYANRLQQKEYEFNIALYDSISSSLERYNENFGFDFILDHSARSGILYAIDKYDITEDFIEKINAEKGKE